MGLFGNNTASRRDQLFDEVIKYLDSQGWKYNIKGTSDSFIEFNMGIKSKLSGVRVVVLVSDKEIQSMAFANIKATQDVLGNVIEYITRANYGLKLGKFEFDYRDGEVRFQTCLPCRDGGMPSQADIEHVVDIPILMMQRYGDGLVKNMMGFGNPAADIEEAEA